ncbi:hypothetical protein CTAYLR_002634 [Chrysophaeum taylorii]|uniref:Ribosomal RNA-processing protein 7 C-terminal domain-containing protein n=1 Tax=Chrysophaeum taylorii TaxID=2483200 RepID=A0AAD7UCQ4_9STRA|nr:hypothetical protein CTAYLR_002634 [Chrysophaeum taylorii]
MKWRSVVAAGDGFDHFMYVRPQSSDAEVFVANVYRGTGSSARAIEACLRATLASVGDIESVELLEAGETAAARVRFGSGAAARRLLAAPRLVLPADLVEELATPFATMADFIARSASECEPVARRIEREAEAALEVFEADKAEEAARRAALRDGQPDADGFVTVSYKRKAVGDAPRESVAARKKRAKLGGGKPADTPPADFYRFQVREAKREKLARLRTSLEADKTRGAKIAAIHRQRRFKV